MAFKIAVDAGHYRKTAGKRCLKKLDKNETREWVLNDRIARYFREAAKAYPGVELLRVDDETSNKSVSLAKRCKAANSFKADLYLSIHHNAGVKGGSGGGIVAYAYKEVSRGAVYRDAIYDACIANGGLVGNRYDPLLTENFQVLRDTDMPAVLMEYGFMDSSTDVPVILKESYAKAMAYATMEAIAQVAGLGLPQLGLPQLQRGDKGEVVRAMQILLSGRGASCDPDGSFGPATLAALQQFMPGRTVCDGVVWAALLGVTA